jgi:hypothetical protein
MGQLRGTLSITGGSGDCESRRTFGAPINCGGRGPPGDQRSGERDKGRHGGRGHQQKPSHGLVLRASHDGSIGCVLASTITLTTAKVT